MEAAVIRAVKPGSRGPNRLILDNFNGAATGNFEGVEKINGSFTKCSCHFYPFSLISHYSLGGE